MTSVMRPLAQLCELGYVRRDIPFGEQARNSKLSLYRLDDPFMRFYFRFVLPYQSALAQGSQKTRKPRGSQDAFIMWRLAGSSWPAFPCPG